MITSKISGTSTNEAFQTSQEAPHFSAGRMSRGLIDTDGHCRFSDKDKKWRITYYTTSKNLANDICSILFELSITHGMIKLIRKNHRKDTFFKPIYHVYIWKRSADRFINIIKPRKLGRMGR